MNHHTIITRPPTENEQKRVLHLTQRDLGSWIYILLFFALLPLFLLGYFLGWVGYLLAIAFFSYIAIGFYNDETKSMQEAQKDLENLIIEEITIETQRVYEIVPIDNNDPILVFDIGNNKVLYIQGQWIRDYETYNLTEDPSLGDEGDDYLNALAPPYAFPTDKFKITRSSYLGEVFSIELLGEYMKPIADLNVLKNENEFKMSEILVGDIMDKKTYQCK